ncbi:hypothetical protein ACQPWO_34950, partial [Escherichia coli]
GSFVDAASDTLVSDAVDAFFTPFPCVVFIEGASFNISTWLSQGAIDWIRRASLPNAPRLCRKTIERRRVVIVYSGQYVPR